METGTEGLEGRWARSVAIETCLGTQHKKKSTINRKIEQHQQCEKWSTMTNIDLHH